MESRRSICRQTRTRFPERSHRHWCGRAVQRACRPLHARTRNRGWRAATAGQTAHRARCDAYISWTDIAIIAPQLHPSAYGAAKNHTDCRKITTVLAFGLEEPERLTGRRQHHAHLE